MLDLSLSWQSTAWGEEVRIRQYPHQLFGCPKPGSLVFFVSKSAKKSLIWRILFSFDLLKTVVYPILEVKLRITIRTTKSKATVFELILSGNHAMKIIPGEYLNEFRGRALLRGFAACHVGCHRHSLSFKTMCPKVSYAPQVAKVVNLCWSDHEIWWCHQHYHDPLVNIQKPLEKIMGFWLGHDLHIGLSILCEFTWGSPCKENAENAQVFFSHFSVGSNHNVSLVSLVSAEP